jgi:2-phosphosulfolactate phosphatase
VSQPTDRPWLTQSEWQVRFEWGPTGVQEVPSEAVVLVDVLRFTTAVDAAVSRGAAVIPVESREAAPRLAAEVGAIALDWGGTGHSLSPVSLLTLGAADRVVLPSPNGSLCSTVAGRSGATVLAACLRNAGAVASWIADRFASVTVVASGERWPDGSLRPCIEDYLSAGAVISDLPGRRSPEAETAAAAWDASKPKVEQLIRECVSGQEQYARGWKADLDFALGLDQSACVPVLVDGAFVDAGREP